MIIKYLTKKSWKDLLEENGIAFEEQMLLDGRYELRVFCWRYNEEQTRKKVKKLIPNIRESQ